MKIHKDGLARDWHKLKYEWRAAYPSVKPHIRRWLKSPWPHDFTNLSVELNRETPYVGGHITMAMLYFIVLPQTLAIIILLWML